MNAIRGIGQVRTRSRIKDPKSNHYITEVVIHCSTKTAYNNPFYDIRSHT